MAAPAIAAPALAQTTAQGRAKVKMLDPMVLTNAESLDFGSIIPSPSGGDVTIAPAGTVGTSGGVIVTPGSAHPARFSGQASASRVVIKTGSSQIFLTGPGAPMMVDNFTFGNLDGLSQLGSSNNFRVISTGGLIGFSVGGRLRVNANQAEGDYTGSFTITFNYQ